LFAESLDLARRMGMKRHAAYALLGLAQVLAALGPTGAVPGRPQADATAPGEVLTVLTPRERDVLKLVAQGQSNKDIAARLVLSEHTVHRHLANILRKLDLSSRAAAAAWGVRAGLV
jgi:DNA-binding NarL/FixJ family response regulator